MLIVGHSEIAVFVPEGGAWNLIGHFDQSCRHDTQTDPREALRAGRLQAVQPVWPDLVFAEGHQVARFRSSRMPGCGGAPVVAASPPPVTVFARPVP
jgi:hypothetical protein